MPALFLLFALSFTHPEAVAELLIVFSFEALVGIFFEAALAAIFDFGIFKLCQGFKNELLISKASLLLI